MSGKWMSTHNAQGGKRPLFPAEHDPDMPGCSFIIGIDHGKKYNTGKQPCPAARKETEAMRNRQEIMRDAETIYDFMAETDTSPL